MADLSTIDPNTPTSTDTVGQGDDQIRALKDALKNSFHGANPGSGAASPEHYGTGPHKFLYGAPASRPAAGHAGRMFWDTTNKRIERDDGASWNMLNAVQTYFATGSGVAPDGGPGIPADIVSVSVDVPTGGRIFVLGMLLAAAKVVYPNIAIDGVYVASQVGLQLAGLDGVCMAYSPTPTAGTRAVSVQGQTGPGAGTQTISGGLMVFVL